MKVGSLVVNIEEFQSDVRGILPHVKFPKKDIIYTIRDIRPGDGYNSHLVAILLDEIINPIAPNGREYDFVASAFREIQPPMDIDIEEIVSSVIKEPVKQLEYGNV